MNIDLLVKRLQAATGDKWKYPGFRSLKQYRKFLEGKDKKLNQVGREWINRYGVNPAVLPEEAPKPRKEAKEDESSKK